MAESRTAFLTVMMSSGIVVVGRHSMARDNGTPDLGARNFRDVKISGFLPQSGDRKKPASGIKLNGKSKQLSINIVHFST